MASALRKTAVAAVLLSASLLAGCGGRVAMTTDEFRAKEAGSVETIEVDRPLRDVAATFRDRAPACIQDVQTTSVNGPPGRMLMSQWRYHETVKVTDRQVELSVQAMTPPIIATAFQIARFMGTTAIAIAPRIMNKSKRVISSPFR